MLSQSVFVAFLLTVSLGDDFSRCASNAESEYPIPVMTWPDFLAQMREWHETPNEVRPFEAGHPILVRNPYDHISINWTYFLDSVHNRSSMVKERYAECNEACFNDVKSCKNVANEFLYENHGGHRPTRHLSYWMDMSERFDPDFSERARFEAACIKKDDIRATVSEAADLINETSFASVARRFFENNNESNETSEATEAKTASDANDAKYESYTSRYLSYKFPNKLINNSLDDFTSIFDLMMSNQTIHSIHFWMGSHGATSTKHWDDKENFYFVVRGEKRFELQSPTLHSSLTIYPSSHASWRHEISQKIEDIDFDSYDSETDVTPKSGDSEGSEGINDKASKNSENVLDPKNGLDSVECGSGGVNGSAGIYEFAKMTVRVDAGEMLYLPSHWFHKVTNMKDDTIAVSIWYHARVYKFINELNDVVIPVNPDISRVLSMSYLMYLIEGVKNRWEHSFGLELNEVYYQRIFTLFKPFVEGIKPYNDMESIEMCDNLLMFTAPNLQYCPGMASAYLDICDLITNRQCMQLDEKEVEKWDEAIETILKVLDNLVITHSIGVAQINWFSIVEHMVNWLTQFQPDWVPLVMIANYI